MVAWGERSVFSLQNAQICCSLEKLLTFVHCGWLLQQNCCSTDSQTHAKYMWICQGYNNLYLLASVYQKSLNTAARKQQLSMPAAVAKSSWKKAKATAAVLHLHQLLLQQPCKNHNICLCQPSHTPKKCWWEDSRRDAQKGELGHFPNTKTDLFSHRTFDSSQRPTLWYVRQA